LTSAYPGTVSKSYATNGFESRAIKQKFHGARPYSRAY
jgi:hypothetical protein